MAAPRPVDILPIVHVGPSAADIAGRVIAADPIKQAQAQAQIVYAAHQKQASAAMMASSEAEKAASGSSGSPKSGNVKVTGFGIVKAVPSADTIIITGSGPADRPPPEKTLILSGLVTPKLSRRKDTPDEPYAFLAKEFLRKLVIGKRVKFTVNYVHESGREFGSAELEGVGDLAEAIVTNGWAKVKVGKENGNGKGKDAGKVKPEQEAICALEQAAIEAKRGIHSGKTSSSVTRVMEYLTSPTEIKDFFNENRGKQLSCIVEQVREGSSLRVELPGQTHKIFVINLAGAQSPRIPPPSKNGSKSPEKPEPFAVDAQYFTAQRLLNRDVTIKIVGCDKFNNLFATVCVTQGDIAVLLLSKGLAKYIDWSASLTPSKAELQAAEAEAKSQKLRLWKKFDSSEPIVDTRGKQYNGKVIQIVSGDTFVVEDALKKEHRLALASIRAPRISFKDRPSEPWAFECKEYLRKKLIGKKVKVQVEYTRTAPADSKGQEARVFVTLFQGKDNVGESLVSQGYASVTRHRMDEDRSEFYEALQTAEEKAIQAKKGVHGGEPPAHPEPYIDLSERIRVPEKGATEDQLRRSRDLTVKTKQFFSTIQRLGKVKAVVEYVFNGGRIKLFVPSQNHVFTFMLSCIRLPAASHGESADPLSIEATEFIKSKIFQQDVEIQVESMDKGDNFLGSLFFERKNLALLLLERGLARLVHYSAERSPYSQELMLYEKAAQKIRVGVWVDYDPEAEKKKADEREAAFKKQREEENQANAAAAQQQKEMIVTVSEAFDPCNFYFQKHEDPALVKIQSALKSLPAYHKSDDFLPHKGTVCLAQFDDGTWYRAKVEKNIIKGLYLVNFFDYGNRGEVTSVRPIPENVPAFKTPPCAHAATLSGIKISQDYANYAIELFQEQVWDKVLTAHVDTIDRDNGKAHVTLYTGANEKEKASISVNEVLLRSGAVRVPSRPNRALRSVIDKMKSAEKVAKEGHKGIWEYGDISSDEDEDNAKSKDKLRR